jgi:uncharacterized protein (UPF0333 family)
MGGTLAIGAVVIVAIILIYEEIEKHNAASSAASAAQAEADASVYAVENQGSEITNVPPGGLLPANDVSEAPNAEINEFVGEAN